MSRLNKIEDMVTVGFFLSLIVGLCLYSVFMFTQPASKLLTKENRAAAELPKLSWNFKVIQEAPAKFEKYFVDRFAFRSDLVYGRNSLLVKAFSVSPSNAVMIGKNSWLYYMIDGDGQQLRHSQLFSPEEVMAWGTTLEQQRVWLARRGIKYTFVLAPSKCSIYPENVPDSYFLLNKSSAPIS